MFIASIASMDKQKTDYAGKLFFTALMLIETLFIEKKVASRLNQRKAL